MKNDPSSSRGDLAFLRVNSLTGPATDDNVSRLRGCKGHVPTHPEPPHAGRLPLLAGNISGNIMRLLARARAYFRPGRFA